MSLPSATHSHVDELTGLDPNVLVGLKASFKREGGIASFKLMKKLPLYAKLDAFAAEIVKPVTMTGCCEREYVLRYVYQEELSRGAILTLFTVDGDSKQVLYESLVSEGSTAVDDVCLRKLVHIRSSLPSHAVRTKGDHACDVLANKLTSMLSKNGEKGRQSVVNDLRAGVNVTISEISTGCTYLLVPFTSGVQQGAAGTFFQLDGKGQCFNLSSFKGFFKVRAVRFTIGV